MSNLDWNAVAQALGQERPDDYHYQYDHNATRYQIEFGKCDGPSGKETLWATYDAYCKVFAQPTDRYAAGTVTLSLVRGIQKIAAQFLYGGSKRYKEICADEIDTVGRDLFSVGLAVALETATQLPDFGDLGPDDNDAVEQAKRYIFTAVRNRMSNHLRDEYPEWWRLALRGNLPQDDCRSESDFDELSRRTPSSETPAASTPEAEEAAHLQVLNAIASACTSEMDKRIIELRDSNYSQKEIAKELGLSRPQVQRALNRLHRKIEELLELPHAPANKRTSRKKGSEGADANAPASG